MWRRHPASCYRPAAQVRIFPFLAPAAAHVIGVDYSAGMLAGARRRVDRAGWSNVELLERSAEDLDDVEPVDCLYWFLGLSVVPRWTELFDATFEALRPGGRCVIVDVYAERRVPMSCVVTRVAQADLSRPTWNRLEERCEGFERRVLSTRDHIHGGHLFLATGTPRPRRIRGRLSYRGVACTAVMRSVTSGQGSSLRSTSPPVVVLAVEPDPPWAGQPTRTSGSRRSSGQLASPGA